MLSRLTTNITAGFFLLLAGWSLFGARAELLTQNAEEMVAAVDLSRLSETARTEVVEALDAATAATLAPDRIYSLAGLTYGTIGDRESSMQLRIRWYCRALNSYGNALERDPFNASLLINWANVRQILGPVHCEAKYTDGDFAAAAREALARDPQSTPVMYAAAMVFLWSGDRPQALSLFRRVLEFQIEPNSDDKGLMTPDQLRQALAPGQEQFLLSELKSGADLDATLPPQFPQIIRWSALLGSLPETRFASLKVSLSKLQSAALLNAQAKHKEGIIPDSVLHRHLMRLLPVVVEGEARRQLDSAIAESFRRLNQPQRARFFLSRQNLSANRNVNGVLKADTRPLKGSFTLWNRDGTVYLDDFYTSIGFFLAPDQSVRLIQLTSRERKSNLAPSSIQILVSEDNLNWKEITASAKLENLDLEGFPLIAIHFPTPKYAAYWKIHYGSSSHSKTFINPLKSLMRIYGDGGI